MNRRTVARESLLFCLFMTLPFAVTRGAESGAADDAALAKALAAPALDAASARPVENVDVRLGAAVIHLGEGVLVPVAAPAGAPVQELVFRGSGRITYEADKAIERAQVELFTGRKVFEEAFDRIVLCGAAAQAAWGREGATAAAGAGGANVEGLASILEGWKGGGRDALAAGWLLRRAAGDPSAAPFGLACWSTGTRSGYVAIDPEQRESFRLVSDGDVVSRVMLRDAEGLPVPGGPTVEPDRYTITAALRRDEISALECTTRIDLHGVAEGARGAMLTLDRAFAVSSVSDADGRPLVHFRAGDRLHVLLGKPLAKDEATTLEIRSSGTMFAKEWNQFTALETWYWHPHAGMADFATYEVTLRWPDRAYVGIVAAGRRVEGGKDQKIAWERRVIDRPSRSFGFEFGEFETVRVENAPLPTTLVLSRKSHWIKRESRDALVRHIADALTFFTKVYGPLPSETMTVVTTDQKFSQGMLGFVTLSDTAIGIGGQDFIDVGVSDYRMTVAHELAHQWWGNAVRTLDDRDQWIEEGMAEYSAALFGRRVLTGKGFESLSPYGDWESALGHLPVDPFGDWSLAGTRTVAAVGPVVLGNRLSSSACPRCRTALMYTKGGMVAEMLARWLGEDRLLGALRTFLAEAAGTPVSTESFLASLSRSLGVATRPFAEHYIEGTSVGLLVYEARTAGDPAGGYSVRLEVEQRPLIFLAHAIEKGPDGRLDLVARKVAGTVDAATTLELPVRIDVKRPGGKAGEKAHLDGAMTLRNGRGQRTVPVPYEPLTIGVDPGNVVLAYKVDATRRPKESLRRAADERLAAGALEDAEAAYRRALDAPPHAKRPDDPPPVIRIQEYDTKRDDALALLGLSEIALTRGDAVKARTLFDDAAKRYPDDLEDPWASFWRERRPLPTDFERILGQGYSGSNVKKELWVESMAAPRLAPEALSDSDRFLRQEVQLARRAGQTAAALDRLRRRVKAFRRPGASTWALLALVAHEAGERDEAREAAYRARKLGVDLGLLDTLAVGEAPPPKP